MEDTCRSLVPKTYTFKQQAEHLARKRQELATDFAAARRFASYILVRCEVCQPAPASFRPLECFTTQSGLDGVSADYLCEKGHVFSKIPLTELARVALTTIHNGNISVQNRQEVSAPVGDYL